MLNLVQLQERLKDVPMQALMQYANGANPQIPPFLALGELNRRKKMQESAAAEQAQAMEGAPTIKEQIEQAAGLMALQGSRQQQAAQQQQQAQASMPMAAPNTTTSAPVQMARGGIVSLADGGPALSIEDLYQNVLGRASDTSGAQYWASKFGSEIDPTEIAAFTQAAQAEKPGATYVQPTTTTQPQPQTPRLHETPYLPKLTPAEELRQAYEQAQAAQANISDVPLRNPVVEEALRTGKVSYAQPGEVGAGLPTNYMLSPEYWEWMSKQPNIKTYMQVGNTDPAKSLAYGQALESWQKSDPFRVNPEKHETFEDYLGAVTASTASSNIPAQSDPYRYKSFLASYYGPVGEFNPLMGVQTLQTPKELGAMPQQTADYWRQAQKALASRAALEQAGLIPEVTSSIQARRLGLIPGGEVTASEISNYNKIPKETVAPITPTTPTTPTTPIEPAQDYSYSPITQKSQSRADRLLQLNLITPEEYKKMKAEEATGQAKAAYGGFLDGGKVGQQMSPDMLKKLMMLKAMKQRQGVAALPVGNMFKRSDYAGGGIVAFAGDQGSYVERSPGFYQLESEVPSEEKPEDVQSLYRELLRRQRERKSTADLLREAKLDKPPQVASEELAELQKSLAEQKAQAPMDQLMTFLSGITEGRGGNWATQGARGAKAAMALEAQQRAGMNAMNQQMAKIKDLRTKAEYDAARGDIKNAQAERDAADKMQLDILSKMSESEYKEALRQQALAGRTAEGDRAAQIYLESRRAQGDTRPDAVILDEGRVRDIRERGAAFVRGQTGEFQAGFTVADKARDNVDNRLKDFKSKEFRELNRLMAEDRKNAAAGKPTNLADSYKQRLYSEEEGALRGRSSPQPSQAPRGSAPPPPPGFVPQQ